MRWIGKRIGGGWWNWLQVSRPQDDITLVVLKVKE
jgi:hypothetical protein